MFWALNAFKLVPETEQVVGWIGFATREQAEAAGRAETVKWGDRMFVRVVEADDYPKAVAQCHKLQRCSRRAS